MQSACSTAACLLGLQRLLVSVQQIIHAALPA